MRNSDVRNKLLEILSETPLVNYACKKVGISRMTFYRWKRDNLDFRKEVEKILSLGRENVSEMAEAALIKNIKDGKMDAIRFYLQNNDHRYMAKRTVYVEPPKPLKVIRSGDICEFCGERKPFPEDFETMKKNSILFTNDEYTREDYEKYLKEFKEKHRHVPLPEDRKGYVVTQESAYEK